MLDINWTYQNSFLEMVNNRYMKYPSIPYATHKISPLVPVSLLRLTPMKTKTTAATIGITTTAQNRWSNGLDPLLSSFSAMGILTLSTNKQNIDLRHTLWVLSRDFKGLKIPSLQKEGRGRSRDGAVVRALASHQCGPGSIPGLGVICGLSLLLVLVLAPRVFLRVLRFSSLLKH